MTLGALLLCGTAFATRSDRPLQSFEHAYKRSQAPSSGAFLDQLQTALLEPLRPQANSATYNDPVGDADGGLAPDITTTTVSNDDVGALSIVISMPSEPYLITGDFVGIFLDTDQTPGTGLARI